MSRPSRYDTLDEFEKQLALAARLEKDLGDWIGPSSSSGEPGRGSLADSKPTEATAIAEPNATERVISDTRRYLATSANIERQIHQLTKLRLSLDYLSEERAREETKDSPVTVGFCEACDTYCTADTDYHKRINGLCGACRKAFDRWDKSDDRVRDRLAFIASIRRQRSRPRRQTG